MLVFLIFNSEVPLRARGYCRRSNGAFESFDGSSGRGLTYSDGHCDGFRRGCGGFGSGGLMSKFFARARNSAAKDLAHGPLDFRLDRGHVPPTLPFPFTLYTSLLHSQPTVYTRTTLINMWILDW